MILRPPQVAQAVGYKHASAVYTLVKQGLLTQPVKIGAQASGWPEHEVQAFVDARAAGADDECMRSIMAGLQRQRVEKLAALKTALGLGMAA